VKEEAKKEGKMDLNVFDVELTGDGNRHGVEQWQIRLLGRYRLEAPFPTNESAKMEARKIQALLESDIECSLARSRPTITKPPIPMIIWCPSCGHRHLDEGEFATKPHHTHACQTCGIVWRPAVAPTVGVRFLPGFKDKDLSDSVSEAIQVLKEEINAIGREAIQVLKEEIESERSRVGGDQ